MSEKYVRLATPADYETVDALVNAAYSNDYGDLDTSWDLYRTAVKRAEYPLDVWVVCRTNTDEVVGTISSRKLGERAVYAETQPQEMDLRLLATSPTARREGIAQFILQHVIQAARDAGFTRILLKTNVNWQGARRLYENSGWYRFTARDGVFDADGNRSKVEDVPCYALDL